MMGYYDLVLGLIPASLLGLTGLLHAVGLEITVAVPLAAVVAVGLMGHAMFVRSPVAPSIDRASAAPPAD